MADETPVHGQRLSDLIKAHFPELAANDGAMDEGRLLIGEIYWRDHYMWLKEQGYLLRPRYHPEWVASWKGIGTGPGHQAPWFDSEDGQVTKMVGLLMDATRIADGKHVLLKKVATAKHPDEAVLGRLLSSSPYASHKDNRCVPIYDVLNVPDDEGNVLIVMPFLYQWDDPPHGTIGEAIEFFRQLFEGLRFLHSLNIAHNDIKSNNLMMDGSHLYDDPVHPADTEMKWDYTGRARKPRSRTVRPVGYYFIDMGHAKRYPPEVGPAQEFIGERGYGGDLTVPEFKSLEYCDPFPVDVYRVGNVIRENFTHGDQTDIVARKRGFEFMEPLLEEMCQDNPAKRPTMEDVVSRFRNIVEGLTSWKLRSRVVDEGEPRIRVGVYRSCAHWARQIGHILRRIPSIPSA